MIPNKREDDEDVDKPGLELLPGLVRFKATANSGLELIKYTPCLTTLLFSPRLYPVQFSLSVIYTLIAHLQFVFFFKPLLYTFGKCMSVIHCLRNMFATLFAISFLTTFPISVRPYRFQIVLWRVHVELYSFTIFHFK